MWWERSTTSKTLRPFSKKKVSPVTASNSINYVLKLCNFRQENPRVVLLENAPVKVYCEIYSIETCFSNLEHHYIPYLLYSISSDPPETFNVHYYNGICR